MTSLARSLGAQALGLLLLVAPARLAVAQENPSREAAELVNALLGGLLGLRPISEAELQEQVASVGGLPFKRAVPIDFLSAKEMARYFQQVFDEEYPEARASVDQRLLTALDLLPPGTELRRVRARLFLENVVGFYDERPGKKRLFAVSDDRSLTPANQLVLAHELRHALQDQYMPIHDLLPESWSDFDDRKIALLSLLEGDATLVMQRFLVAQIATGEQDGPDPAGLTLPAPDLPGTPRVLRDQLLLPYTAGLEFARKLVQRSGFSGMQEAFKHPPESTEQVLHPEKYFSRETPRSVWLPDAPAGVRQLSAGVLGELLLGSLLGEASEEAAAGWGGDLYRVYDAAGKTLVVARSVWDSPAEQREFHARLLGRYSQAHAAARPEGRFSVFEGNGWTTAVAASASGVALLASDDRALLARAIALEPEP